MSDNMIATKIYHVLNRYRKNPYGLTYNASILIEKINYFVTHQLPIKMLIPACHGKVDSPHCVFNHLPDLGDVLGIQNFVALCEEIRAIYANGVELIMIHEGHFYTGMLIKNDESVDAYLANIRSLIAPYAYIKSIGLRDFFPEFNSNAACRTHFFNHVAPTIPELKKIITTDERLKQLYVSYKKIHTGHFVSHKFPELNLSQQKKEAKKQALNQLQTYLGFGKLVTQFFANQSYIRLSTLYKDPKVQDQVALNYLPNKHHLSTPSFHCVVKQKDGNYDFIKRYEAIARGYQVCQQDGYAYFEAR